MDNNNNTEYIPDTVETVSETVETAAEAVIEKPVEAIAEKLTDKDVTAHTASLWKYNPVPESPEPFPESVCREETAGGFTVTAASVRGKKHKHEGSNGDDGFAFEIADGIVIAAVADGAGSKPFSRIGARASCNAVIKYAKMRLEAIKRDIPDYRAKLGKPLNDPDFGAVCSAVAELLRGCFAEAYAAVEAAFDERRDKPEFEAAIGRNPEIKDFSCTLLTAVMIPVDTENGREYLTASIQLGDGMIAAFDENAENPLIILGAADSGDFAGETEFITSDQHRTPECLMSRTKIRRGRLTSLMMMTDGVADDYYPNDPQLLRLALDMKLNGIMNIGSADIPENVNVPEPAAYPWVNDSDISYALQYAKAVLSETGMTLKDLWRNKGVQQKASLASFGICHDRNRAEMLKIWLDNYVERGSFDDRTLLIVNVDI